MKNSLFLNGSADLKQNRFFVTVFIFFLILCNAYSKGAADKDYSEVKERLEAKDSVGAMEDVLTVIESKPESLEYGIMLSREAMRNQELFRKKFDELLFLLYKNPNNENKKLALIAALEALEPEPDAQMKFFLNQLKISSTYAAYRVRFNILMDEGIAFIKAEKYNEAAKTFIKGFSIYNKEFQEENEGTELQSQLNSQLDNVRTAVKRYEQAYSKFFAGIRNYQKSAIYEETPDLEKESRVIEKNLEELRKIGNDTVDAGNALKGLYLREAKTNKKIDETIFPFVYRLTLGRDTASEFEGVDGAMEAGVYNNLLSLVGTHWTEIRKLWDRACGSFDFRTDFSVEKNIAAINAQLASLKKVYTLGNTNAKSRFKKTINSETEKHVTVNSLIEIIKNTKTVYSSFLGFKKRLSRVGSNYAGSVEDLRNLDGELLVGLNSGISESGKLTSDLEGYYNDTGNYVNVMEHESKALQEKQKILLERLADIRLDFYEQLAFIKNKSGEAALAASKNDYSIYNNYFSGSKKNKNFTFAEAVQKLDIIKKNIGGDIKILNGFMEETKGLEKKLTLSEKFLLNKKGIETNIALLKELEAKVNKDLVTGNAVLLKINLAKNEADLRYEEASRNLRASSFSAARRSLELSRNKTNDALVLEEDAEYRKLTDERLEKLSKEINDEENKVVVKDVRRYLQDAKKDYFNSEFQAAENKLVAARNRWAVTNAEPNEEITNWINVVQSAGAVRTERIIQPSAPLYPQMMQLLNNSSELYSDAVKKMQQGSRAAAIKSLNEAKENIKQVLLVYPSNGTAGQLSLKIDKLIDPDNFSSQFARKIAAIKNGYRTNTRQLYNELLNLYSIDRNFPGIVRLKDEMEIYLGLKVAPPDSESVKQSAELTKSARKIYEDRNTISLASSTSMSVAIEQLDRAIRLDPNNVEAVALKDAIRIYVGGTSTVVLSAENEAKYQQAVAELQNGNRIIAAALVQQLLQNPNAKNSAKVLELKKRIDAQL